MTQDRLGPDDDALVKELVVANHILYQRGIVDGFGHVSARRPRAPSTFLISRSLAPQLVEASDIQVYGLDGDERNGDTRRGYLERFIHSEIYRARPDVMAVIHSHSPAVLPFSIVKDQPLRPVSHMAGFIGTAAPVYEIRDNAGTCSDMLIRTPDLGRTLAASLGEDTVVLMRGHGSTVVGASLEQAVFRALYVEQNARTQLAALQLGEVTYLTPEEAAAADLTNNGQVSRAFDLWKREVEEQAADGQV